MITNDWKTAFVMMAFMFIMCLVMAWLLFRDNRKKRLPANELRNLHFAPPAPPAPPVESDVTNGGPWFLVVYDQDFKVSLMVAADDILRFKHGGEGEIRIQLKHNIGASSNDEIWLENQFEYKFLPASRMGDYLVDVEN